MFKTIALSCRTLSLRHTQAKSSIRILVYWKRNYAAPAYFHQTGKEPLCYRNLGQQIQRAAEIYTKRPAIISCYENKKLTYEQAKSEAEKLAVKLRDLGLQQGDHLGIWAPNSIQWYVCFLASVLGGYPLVCLNPALQAQEITYALKKGKVRVLVTMDECGKQNFRRILKKVLVDHNSGAETINNESLPDLRAVIMKTSTLSMKEFLNYDTLMSTAADEEKINDLNGKVAKIAPEVPCNIQFTSGTTGQPKAAVLTHFNFVNLGHSFGQSLNLHKGTRRICLTVPLFHCYALGITVASLDYGGTLVLPSATFNAKHALAAIEEEGCNVVLGTPTMYVDMLEQQPKLNKALHSLELGLMGGAACSPEIYSGVRKVFGLKEVRIAYGQTESTSAIFSQDGTEVVDQAVHTVGKLYDHAEAKIINERGDTVAFGQPGELCVRGYFTMRGYLDDEEKTKEALSGDGWLRTGDEFILEPTGIGRIVGRKKEMIIRGGENIFPKEIEDFLNAHQDILEAQVIGVPDARMGEEVCAYLRLKPDVPELTVADIKEFCKERIAHFKVPRYVRIIDEFPKTTSGKIQKFKLLEIFLQTK